MSIFLEPPPPARPSPPPAALWLTTYGAEGRECLVKDQWLQNEKELETARVLKLTRILRVSKS